MILNFGEFCSISISCCTNLIIKVLVENDYLLELSFKNMFDIKELRLMFLDPTDLIINNINKSLSENKTIKFIFS